MRVSVCTSVLNQSDLLRRQIESVRAQTFTDWEHIIVDDGSTEDIRSLVESFNDPRMVYVRFPENRGFQAGYNHAMSLATGDYINLLAADEFLWERKFEIQVPWMDEHPLIGCCWGLPTPNVGKPWELGQAPVWEQYAHRAHNRSRESWIKTLLMLEDVPIGGASMLMRRECMQAIGGFDPQFAAVSDLEWFVRFFERYQGWILPYRMADATHPPERTSAKATEESFADEMRRVREKHKIVLPVVTGRVTVGMPVRNMAKYVGDAIQSILDQTFTDFDLLILDDASNDEGATLAAIQKFTDPRIKLLQFDENRGVAQAQNQMLGSATTEFFTLLAADDKLESTFLERCLAEFARDPFLEMVACQTDFLAEDGSPHTGEHVFKNIQRPHNKPREQWLAELYAGNQYFGSAVYRTQALLDVGGWDPELGVVMDWEMYVKLLQRSNIHVIPENLTHTRVHDAQRSVGKGRQWTLDLRKAYHLGRTRYWAPRRKVIIATPFYEMRGFTPYITSMVATIKLLCHMGINHEFWDLSGDSYVDRAKNTLLNKFLEDPDATDLFMIDSDMQWEPGSFINMLNMPQEIVQGSYPQKNMWEIWTARPQVTEDKDVPGKFQTFGYELPDGSALIKAEYLAGGYIRIKREALEKYKDKYKDYVYYDQGADPAAPDRLYTEFFTCLREVNSEGQSLRWGEDRVFGRRMKEIGIESWIYTNADMGHYGVKGWFGNFHKHLTEQKAKLQ